MDWANMSIDNWLEEMKKRDFIDIEHATKEDLLSLCVVGLSNEEEKRVYERAKELGMKLQ